MVLNVETISSSSRHPVVISDQSIRQSKNQEAQSYCDWLGTSDMRISVPAASLLLLSSPAPVPRTSTPQLGQDRLHEELRSENHVSRLRPLLACGSKPRLLTTRTRASTPQMVATPGQDSVVEALRSENDALRLRVAELEDLP